MTASDRVVRKAAKLAVIVAALGYFVDIYDLILFGTVRKPSLIALGYTTKDALTTQGLHLFYMQMGGLLVGGILWGMLGDKRGRLSVLFGSIITYSLANLANGMVHSLGAYSVCRLIAGIGLAGELGAGITLVSELMGKEARGIGTTLVAAIGVAGGVVGGLVSGAVPSVWAGVDWRTAYYLGGGLGLLLLLLRIGVAESGMFHTVRKQVEVSRGDFFSLFTDRKRLTRYLALIGVGVPSWYILGILITFSDRVGGALGLDPAPNPATSLMWCYAGCALGGLGCGLLSQRLRSRKRALAWFLGLAVIAAGLYFAIGGASLDVFYAMAFLLGVASGYWAVFVSAAAEQFGTNLRATVATTTPNFVRGSAALLAFGFEALLPSLHVVGAAIAVGVVAFAAGGLGLGVLRETYGVDLDYVEPL